MKGKSCHLMKSTFISLLRCSVFALVCFSLCLSSIFSQSASAINYGKVYPNTIRFGWYTTAGASGFDTKNFGGSVNSPSIFGGIDPIQYFEGMRFGGFSIKLDQNMYFLLSYKISVSSEQQKYWGSPPLVAPPSGFGDNQGGCIGTQVLDSSITPLSSSGSGSQLDYYVNVLGRAFGNNSTQTCMNFSGQWLANYAIPDQHLNWSVYQPIISFAPDFEQLSYFELQYNSSLLYGIKEILNRGITANIDDSAIVNQQQQTTQAVKDAADQAHKDSQAQTEAINAQTKQDKDQYDQEKEEEAEREESATSDANGLAGIFNITILNPFAGIWEIFNSGGCTSIPTISAWLGSEDTTYCSWWPQSIRATLTPVFSLASMMLLFGFVAKWLGGNEGIKIDGVKF